MRGESRNGALLARQRENWNPLEWDVPVIIAVLSARGVSGCMKWRGLSQGSR